MHITGRFSHLPTWLYGIIIFIMLHNLILNMNMYLELPLNQI